MVLHLVHKLRESHRVIDGLGLEKLRPAGHFVRHALEFLLSIRGTRIDHRSDTKGRRAVEGLPAKVRAGLQSSHCLEQSEHVQVEDRLGVWMIPRPWRVAGHAPEMA